jgi:hypothetical protein
VVWLLGSLALGVALACAAIGYRHNRLESGHPTKSPRWSTRLRLFVIAVLAGGAALEIVGNPWKDRALAVAVGYLAVYVVKLRLSWRRWRADPGAAALSLHAARTRNARR